MAVVKCPDCGQDVSDRANVCIHCGAPLNFSVRNGEVKIKCSALGGRRLNVTITDIDTDEVLATIKPNETITLQIKKDTNVHLSYFALKGCDAILKYKGEHMYNIQTRPVFLTEQLVLQEVSIIDSD